jgi:beta-glucosidase
MKEIKEIKFPKGFLWGGATSSHQVEGGCVNNDWFLFEQIPAKIDDGSVSGDACDHYNRYRDDFKLLKSLNHNAHRFSIEWSRVEPAKNYFSKVELDHYKDMVKSIKENGMEPMVTLHHFSTPVWLAREGSWANPKIIDRFEKYTQVVAEAIGKDVKFWLPINEPIVYTFLSWMSGEYAPGFKNPRKGFQVGRNMLVAHTKSYNAIKKVNPKAQVGFNRHMRIFDPLREDNKRDIAAAARLDNLFNMETIDALFDRNYSGKFNVMKPYKDEIMDRVDFIALNYYARDHIKFSLLHPETLFGKFVVPEGVETSHQGEGEYYPHGIYRLIEKLQKYNVPVYITENGVATEKDKYRLRYMASHITEVGKAIADGMDVRGYLFWSTLDNFEWAKGYTMKFGMIGVDFKTQKRTVRPSAKMFSDIAKKNKIDSQVLKKYGVKI